METLSGFENIVFHVGSYPTYEEWKRDIVSLVKERIPNVLILPMRNGNCRKMIILFLWAKVLILPMRNGNYQK